ALLEPACRSPGGGRLVRIGRRAPSAGRRIAAMRCASAFVLFGLASACAAAGLKDLPANTFVEIKYTNVQPPGAGDDKGYFARQGWNKVVYDPDSKRVLLYDRWIDKRHGGYSIYGNCLFALDPAAGTMTPLRLDNWTKLEPKGGGYR